MAITPKALRELGFEYISDETYKEPSWPHNWRGFARPVVDCEIDGDPFEGFSVIGSSKTELDRNAIDYAREVRPALQAA